VKKFFSIIFLIVLLFAETHATHMGEMSQFFDKEHSKLAGGLKQEMKIYYKDKSGIKFGFRLDYNSRQKESRWKRWVSQTDNAAKYWCEKYNRDSYRKSFVDHGSWNNKARFTKSAEFTIDYVCEPSTTNYKNNSLDEMVDAFVEDIIEFFENHSCSKKYSENEEKLMECFFYPRLFASSPVENFYRIEWKKGNMSRNEFFELTKHSINTYKEMCEDLVKNSKKIQCYEKMEELNIKLTSIPK
tara:strand:+ start:59 stop:787 length:729 start_codon:yes stop_codon:yes gene_type:complete